MIPCSLSLCLAVAGLGFAGGEEPGAPAPAPIAEKAAKPSKKLPIDRGIGQPLSASVTLIGLDGKPVRLKQFVGRRAIVLIFAGTQCPVGNLYMPTVRKVADEFKDKAIQFVVVNSNASETLDDVRAHAKEYGLDGAGPHLLVVKDPNSELADLALAERTNEAVIVDGTLAFDKIARIRYRGEIDDQYDFTTRRDKPTRETLKKAIEDFLANKPIRTEATEVVGCLIERGKPVVKIKVGNNATVRGASPEVLAAFDAREAAAKVDGPVTYSEHIAPILQAKCQSCHRADQVAPFPLLTYKDAKRWSGMIAEVVEARRMPPWHADPRHGAFSNDRSLTAIEKAQLLAWVDQEAPEGDPAKAPAPRTFAEGWTIGEPDLILESPRTQYIPAGGVVDYVREFLPDVITEDKWVKAAEIRPSDAAVVHHVILYYIPPGERNPRFLVGYAPGDLSVRYEEGMAKRLPAHSKIFFELHYTPIGQIRTDRTRVGLVFAKPEEKITKEAIVREAIAEDFAKRRVFIPAGDSNFALAAEAKFPRPMKLIAFMPHMHLRGKDFLYKLVDPSGGERVLLSVPAFDYAWQSYYWLKEPIDVEAGSRLVVEAHYDNSAANPANPDPTSKVYWGDQTFEEMMIGFYEVIEDADRPRPAASPKPAENQAVGNFLRKVLGNPKPAGTQNAVAAEPKKP
jgi:thiol-disulfide isomerase/thioredoxin